MKMVLSTLVFFMSTSVFAATQVMPNVYMAAGPATKNYQTNLNKLSAEFSKVSSSDLGALKFAGAFVDNDLVHYDFHRLESSDNVQTCWSQLSFDVSSAANPVVSSISAKLSCKLNND